MAGFDQIGAVWSLFDFIIGGGDSAEIKEMREQFRKTNVKIERLDKTCSNGSSALSWKTRHCTWQFSFE